jgi:hypothetical protein
MSRLLESTLIDLKTMQRKEDHKHSSPRKKRRRKRLEADKEKEFSELFTFWMNSWYDYVNACNKMYAEYIRNTTNWLDAFSKFWSGQYKDKENK